MPSLRYFVHLDAPGWNVIGGGEPPFVGVDAGNNENMAWGFTFAGIDMVDTFVEQTNPADPNQTMYKDAWEPMKVIREEIKVKGEEKPRVVELKFSKHGPVFYEDPVNHLAFAAKSVNQEPGTARVQGQSEARPGGELRGLLRSRDVLEDADAQPHLRRQRRATSRCR